MDKKYVLTEETIVDNGTTLHRIQAVRDFFNVEAGELGGYIESEENLSHEGNCWVADISKVFGDSKISGSGIVGGYSVIKNSVITDDAYVTDSLITLSEIRDSAAISGNSSVYNSTVREDALVKESSVSDSSIKGIITERSIVQSCTVDDYARVHGGVITKAHIGSNACIRGKVNGGSRIIYVDSSVDLGDEIMIAEDDNIHEDLHR